jgi:molybdate transport system regulatory protein
LHPAGRIWLQERGAHVFGPGAQELLHHLDEAGSLNQAAKDMKMSYSKAWRMVREIEQGLGVTLLARQTGGTAGGGSRLTDEGRLVLERFEAFTKDVDATLEELFRRHFSDLPYGMTSGPQAGPPRRVDGSPEGRRPSRDSAAPPHGGGAGRR